MHGASAVVNMNGIANANANVIMIVITLLAAAEGTARGNEPGGDGARDDDARWAAIEHVLPAPLRAVMRPRPALPDASMRAKLAWLATLARRADDREGYSARTAWRTIMAWPEGDALSPWPSSAALAAPDLGLERYPVPAGRADPAIDFAASVALAWLDARHFSCDFPLRARFLRDVGLAPPGPLPIEAGRCAAFEAWARPDEVAAIEVVFVAQRWSDAAATMGHVLFRVRRAAPSGGVVGPSFEMVFSYVAKDAPDTPGYLIKGMTGGLSAGVKVEAFGDAWARYGVREGRDLQVFELALSPEERRFLLAEVFAQARRGMRVPYAFFQTNCATLAWDTLRAVMPELPPHAGVLVHPHEVPGMLLAAGRATTRGTIPAVSTRAKQAEARRESLVAALEAAGVALPTWQAAHARRWRDAETRAAALRALSAEVRASAGALTGPARERLAAWTDAVLDIEAFAIDRREHGYVAGASSPALEAALDLRALLPPRVRPDADAAPLAPVPDASPDASPVAAPDVDPEVVALRGELWPVRASGSRKGAVLGGWMPGRATLTWRTSVLDEAVGEPRQAVLARGARMRLLVNELTLASDGAAPTIAAERFVIVDSASFGDGVRTDQSWLAARSGFAFGLEARAGEGLPFAALAHIGPTLTLAAGDGFAAHLLAEADVRLATWTGVAEGALFRATLGLRASLGLPIGAAHRLRVAGRVGAGADLDGFALEREGDAAIEIALGTSGVFLVASAGARGGLPAGNGVDARLGIAY